MREAGFVGGRSINLAMSRRGWKAIEKAGIKDKIEAVAIPMPGRKMRIDFSTVWQGRAGNLFGI